MISRFFFPAPLPDTAEIGLPDKLAHHAARVLRLREGDEIVLFDGTGGEVPARLAVRGKRWYAVPAARRNDERESPVELVLVQALAGGDKMDWIVQKAVELGVAAVVPVRAQRSVLRLSGERALKRVGHWQEVAISACEQSGRNRIPRVEEIADLDTYLERSRSVPTRLVLDPTATRRLASLDAPPRALHLLIGPEGGWSDAEVAMFGAAGCTPVTLGPRVLRTETAGLAAASAIQALWGDF